MDSKKVKETNVNTQIAYNDFDIYWKTIKIISSIYKFKRKDEYLSVILIEQ